MGLPHFGHAGVDFFFVLSGFIITFVHRTDIGKPKRLGHYLERRFTRVFPFYWLVLIFSLLATWLLHRAQFPAVREILANLLLLPQTEDKIVGGAWTLVYEIMFYFVFAIAICNRRIGAAVLCVWAALVAAGFFLTRGSGSFRSLSRCHRSAWSSSSASVRQLSFLGTPCRAAAPYWPSVSRHSPWRVYAKSRVDSMASEPRPAWCTEPARFWSFWRSSNTNV